MISHLFADPDKSSINHIYNMSIIDAHRMRLAFRVCWLEFGISNSRPERHQDEKSSECSSGLSELGGSRNLDTSQNDILYPWTLHMTDRTDPDTEFRRYGHAVL